MERREGVMRSTATVLLTYVGTAGFTAVLTLYLVRALGAEGFGIFSLAMGVAGLMSLVADFGIAASMSRFMAEAVGDRPRLARVFAAALRLKLALGGLVAVVLIAAAGPIAAAYDEPALVWPLRALAVASLMQSVLGQISGGFFAMGRTASNLRMVVVESMFELAASVAFVAAGAGAAGAAWGRATGYAVGTAFGLALMVRLLGGTALAVQRRGGARMTSMGRYAMWLWVVNGAYTLFSQLDLLAIGAILGPAAVGAFSAPLRLSALLAYPALAVANSVTPRIARRPGAAPDHRLIERALRWLTVLQGALLAPLVVWAQPIVSVLLGSDYGASVGVMRAMAPFVFLQGLATLVSLAVNYVGEARRRVPWAIAAVVINLAIDLALLKPIGVVAAALGTSVAFTVYVVGHLLICRRTMELRLRPFAVTLGRCLVAAAAMAGVLALFGTADLSVAEWIGGSILGLAAYAAALLALREVAWVEVRRASGIVVTRLGRT